MTPRGSSPRAWGDSHRRNHRTGWWRFIPTRVGRLMDAGWRRASFRVHPHARGAISPSHSIASASAGSSPRAWGDCFLTSSQATFSRFIPTRVGRFGYYVVRRARLTVHPHARGAIFTSRLTAKKFFRFIPTRVGRLLRNASILDTSSSHTREALDILKVCLNSCLWLPVQ